ncbi:MAG: VOC family protein, partial [Halobacteria archaeon]|nr:VOC family protein [Halobacteria archaeon]
TVMGHVHIESSDLRRTEEFYEDVLGLNLRTRFGDSAIFLAVDDYHHHIGANSWQRRTEESKDESLGLSYFEFLDSDLPKLKRRLEDANLQYEETSEGLWVRDPDNIRILFKA